MLRPSPVGSIGRVEQIIQSQVFYLPNGDSPENRNEVMLQGKQKTELVKWFSEPVCDQQQSNYQGTDKVFHSISSFYTVAQLGTTNYRDHQVTIIRYLWKVDRDEFGRDELATIQQRAKI